MFNIIEVFPANNTKKIQMEYMINNKYIYLIFNIIIVFLVYYY